MGFGLGRSGRVTAGATFYGLLLLAFGLLAALSGFVSYFAPFYSACKSVWDNLLLQASSVGVALPSLVIGSTVIMAGLTLIRQWHATQRLLSMLTPYRVPVPPRMAEVASEVGLEERVDCVSDVLSVPFCYGFVRPRVCVPVALLEVLDDSELRAVLRHEAHHARNYDPLKIWLSRALARGLYFLPLARDLRDSYLAAKEIAADEVMVQADELPLASALVKMLSTAKPQAEASLAALAGLSVAGLISVTYVPANDTERRIRRLVDGRPALLRLPPITSVLVSLAIVAAIFGASYANLSAASVMPVSQECVTDHLLRAPEPVLRGRWPAASSEALGAPVVVRTPDEPTRISVEERHDCSLLTPNCTNVDLLSVGSTPSSAGAYQCSAPADACD